MTDLVKARFVCQSVLNMGSQIQPKLVPIWTGHPDDNSYSKATPGGAMELWVSNPNVFDFFEPETVYDIVISKHDGPAYTHSNPVDEERYKHYHMTWFKHWMNQYRGDITGSEMARMQNLMDSLLYEKRLGKTDFVEADISAIASRFLTWVVPDDFDPDGGIKYEPGDPRHGRPCGTNILTAYQAEAMVRYILGMMP